jgi:hypothetical protein
MEFFYNLNKRLNDLAAANSTQLNEGKGVKPDYIDLDKDGDRKEPMKKAAADAKSKFKKTNEAAKPDFLDLDRDGDRKEPMKKAAADNKSGAKQAFQKQMGGSASDLTKGLSVKKKQTVKEAADGIDQILANFPREVEMFKHGGELDQDLEEALWDYHYNRGTIRNYNADASAFIAQDLADHLGLNEGSTGDYSAKKARAGKDIGKPGKNFEKIAKSAGERYGSKAAGERVAGAVLNKLRGKNESVEEATKEIPGGRRHTSEPGGYGRKDDEDAPKAVTKKGRGRPKKGSDSETGEVMKPDWSAFGVGKVNLPKHKGAVTKHKMVGEGEDGDVEAAIRMLKKAGYTVSKDKKQVDEKVKNPYAVGMSQAMKSTGDKPPLKKSTITKAHEIAKKVDEENTDTRDNRAEKAGKRVTKDIEYDEKVKDRDHGAKRGAQDAKAEKAGKKVAKDIEHDEKVDETTTSGSVAPAASTPKSAKGMTFGKGIYDSWNRELEGMIAESINVSVNMSTGGADGVPTKNITVSAEGEDADRLSELLMMAGLGSSAPATEGSGCGTRQMDENAPDWPTNTEYSDDAFQYSGGLNKPKSTGQTTAPVIASQMDRQETDEEIEENYDPYFDPESRESQKYKEPRDDVDPDSEYPDDLDEIRLMKERAGITDGKYTQDYFTANQPSRERQRAEADREHRPNTAFSRDPIEATTDRAVDKLSSMFKMFKKK